MLPSLSLPKSANTLGSCLPQPFTSQAWPEAQCANVLLALPHWGHLPGLLFTTASVSSHGWATVWESHLVLPLSMIMEPVWDIQFCSSYSCLSRRLPALTDGPFATQVASPIQRQLKRFPPGNACVLLSQQLSFRWGPGWSLVILISLFSEEGPTICFM